MDAKNLLRSVAILTKIRKAMPVVPYFLIADDEELKKYRDNLNEEGYIYEVNRPILTDRYFTEAGEVKRGVIVHDCGVDVNTDKLKIRMWCGDYTVQVEVDGKIYVATTGNVDDNMIVENYGKCKMEESKIVGKSWMPIELYGSIEEIVSSIEENGELVYEFVDKNDGLKYRYYKLDGMIFKVVTQEGYEGMLDVYTVTEMEVAKEVYEHVVKLFGMRWDIAKEAICQSE